MTFWNQVSGKIPYPLTNDYLFRVVVQRHDRVLRDILCSMLSLKEEDIQSIRITNQIVPGERIDEKEYILDINLLMNGSITVNIELQVINYNDWPERSLQYLCRSFDLLNKGQLYSDSKTTIHIGILSFALFPDFKEYFSSFRMMSEGSHKVFTDKFQLYTLCLPNLKHATKNDASFRRDMWGRYFKVKTWEELKAMADVYPVIEETAEEVYKCITDEAIRRRIEAREDYERRQRTLLWQLAEKDRQMAEKLAEKDEQLAEKLAEKDEQLAEKDSEIADLKRRMAEAGLL